MNHLDIVSAKDDRVADWMITTCPTRVGLPRDGLPGNSFSLEDVNHKTTVVAMCSKKSCRESGRRGRINHLSRRGF